MQNFEIVEPRYESGSARGLASAAGRALRPLPEAGIPFDVRRGRLADFDWVDAMQKADREGLGFRHEEELQGHLREGRVWIAETPGSCAEAESASSTVRGSADMNDRRVAYCLAKDKYTGREDVGLIVQMAVAPAYRRSLVAANLLARVFDDWPRGVRLCGCWCAQDLPANRFWEACGFRALAFRTGAREARWTTYDDAGNPTGKAKGHRIHIYWQKKVRGEHDDGVGGVNYWYPGETGGGSINESRLVFPIPPGSSWKDAKPAILPGVGEMFEALRAQREELERKALLQLAPPPEAKATSGGKRKTKAERVAEAEAKAAAEAAKSAERKRQEAAADAARAGADRGGLRFAPLPPDRTQIAKAEAERAAAEARAAEEAKEADAAAKKQAKADAKRAAKAAVKQLNRQNDPQLKAMARELRDRWMEAVEADPGVLSLPSDARSDGGTVGYDVARQIVDEATPGRAKRVENVKRLAA